MSDNKRKLRSSGSTSAIALDKTKVYKLDSTGAIVEATSESDTDIVFSGSKSSLRRIADLERNVSILAAKALTTDAGNNDDIGQVEYAVKSGKWSSARTLSLTGAVSGSVSIDGSGNVSLSTTASSPVISLTGDVTGSATMSNLGNVSIAATIQPNSVALGTDTTGNYMVNVSGGTGISVSHTQSEGSTATVSVDTSTIATRSYADSAAAAVKTELLGGAGAAYDTLSELKSLIDSGDASLSSAISGLTIGNGTQTVTAGSYLTGGGSFTANQTGNSSVSLAVDATSANTASKVVARDASGNFSAGTITATLSGNASSASSVPWTGVTGRPTAVSSFTNDSGYVTSSGVTSVATGNGLTGGTITGTGTLSMSGSYTGNFAVTGNITATGEITAYYSDGRLKTNLAPIEGALSKVMAINGYTYDSNEVAESLGLPKHMDQIGLLAQEVEAVLPELVTQSALEGYKTIRYDKVVSVLVNAIKEQQAQIEELQAAVKKTLH